MMGPERPDLAACMRLVGNLSHINPDKWSATYGHRVTPEQVRDAQTAEIQRRLREPTEELDG